ncbi:hypothetical protein N7468_003517 [Penicillium chermesinum]|uniref:Uncharacterized protein n=1 Tax=Penicillium chermesinum TaxID=63820 RepID=A0A9W9TSB9_9EURO|nr:uncharacterized protein N7468_003517 [Penicillium chermesinum]KAJ5238898.1 hypothetical protein N7468_003517 [Penicillium chermesinum]
MDEARCLERRCAGGLPQLTESRGSKLGPSYSGGMGCREVLVSHLEQKTISKELSVNFPLQQVGEGELKENPNLEGSRVLVST